MSELVKDIDTFMRLLDCWREGCPLARKGKPLFGKLKKHRYAAQMTVIDIATRYQLPAWEANDTWKARMLDAFDAHADYGMTAAKGGESGADDVPATLAEAIETGNLLNRMRARRLSDITPDMLARLRSDDDDIALNAADRLAYFRLELALATLVPGARWNVGRVLSLTGPVSVWGDVCKDRLPDDEHAAEGDAANGDASDGCTTARTNRRRGRTPLPELPRLRAALAEALPPHTARAILHTQQRWLQARRAWENEMQWAGHVAHRWEPPKGKPDGHGDGDTVTDWGKQMFALQLELARLTDIPALPPLVEAACAYLSAATGRTVKPSLFLEPMEFSLNEASPKEMKKRRKQAEAQRAKEQQAKAQQSLDDDYGWPRPVFYDDEPDYGMPHEWQVLPNWCGTGNVRPYYAPDIQPPWERDSYPKH